MIHVFGWSVQPDGTTRRTKSFIDSFEITPTGSHAAITAAGVYIAGLRIAATPRRHEPGPSDGSPRCSLKTAPPERDAAEAGLPSASVSPSKDSPAEWATMNQGGTPAPTTVPITAPAEVPTMESAEL